MFSVCVLIYGDYPELAKRVLTSIVASQPQAGMISDIRIGLNEVSVPVCDWIYDFCKTGSTGCPCYVYEPPRNVGKYPLMRRMFYDAKRPLAERVMWFDDDSYISATGKDGYAWWLAVKSQSWNAMIGHIYTIGSRGNQYLGIQAQSWFKNKPVRHGHRFRFVTGGWWAIPGEFLTTWNYPFPEIFHNGGDSILGELIRQQNFDMQQFKLAGIEVNVGGRAARRGLGKSLQDEVYPWQNYNPGVLPDYTHHCFDCAVHSFGV